MAEICECIKLAAVSINEEFTYKNNFPTVRIYNLQMQLLVIQVIIMLSFTRAHVLKPRIHLVDSENNILSSTKCTPPGKGACGGIGDGSYDYVYSCEAQRTWKLLDKCGTGCCSWGAYEIPFCCC